MLVRPTRRRTAAGLSAREWHLRAAIARAAYTAPFQSPHRGLIEGLIVAVKTLGKPSLDVLTHPFPPWAFIFFTRGRWRL
jgi:hypothetical protein